MNLSQDEPVSGCLWDVLEIGVESALFEIGIDLWIFLFIKKLQETFKKGSVIWTFMSEHKHDLSARAFRKYFYSILLKKEFWSKI